MARNGTDGFDLTVLELQQKKLRSWKTKAALAAGVAVPLGIVLVATPAAADPEYAGYDDNESSSVDTSDDAKAARNETQPSPSKNLSGSSDNDGNGTGSANLGFEVTASDSTGGYDLAGLGITEVDEFINGSPVRTRTPYGNRAQKPNYVSYDTTIPPSPDSQPKVVAERTSTIGNGAITVAETQYNDLGDVALRWSAVSKYPREVDAFTQLSEFNSFHGEGGTTYDDFYKNGKFSGGTDWRHPANAHPAGLPDRKYLGGRSTPVVHNQLFADPPAGFQESGLLPSTDRPYGATKDAPGPPITETIEGREITKTAEFLNGQLVTKIEYPPQQESNFEPDFDVIDNEGNPVVSRWTAPLSKTAEISTEIHYDKAGRTTAQWSATGGDSRIVKETSLGDGLSRWDEYRPDGSFSNGSDEELRRSREVTTPRYEPMVAYPLTFFRGAPEFEQHPAVRDSDPIWSAVGGVPAADVSETADLDKADLEDTSPDEDSTWGTAVETVKGWFVSPDKTETK